MSESEASSHCDCISLSLTVLWCLLVAKFHTALYSSKKQTTTLWPQQQTRLSYRQTVYLDGQADDTVTVDIVQLSIYELWV